jgi:hypothetical protein
MLPFTMRSAQPRPRVGALVAIKAELDEPLAGIPGRITAVLQRVRSGDYLVTVRYDKPQHVDHTMLNELDVFLSELDHVERAASARYSV